MKSTTSKYGYGSDNKYARQHPPTAVSTAPPTPFPHPAMKTTDTGDPILYAPDGYCFGAIHLCDVRLEDFRDWFAAWNPGAAVR